MELTKSMKNFSKSEISMKKEDQRLLECKQGKFIKEFIGFQIGPGPLPDKPISGRGSSITKETHLKRYWSWLVSAPSELRISLICSNQSQTDLTASISTSSEWPYSWTLKGCRRQFWHQVPSQITSSWMKIWLISWLLEVVLLETYSPIEFIILYRAFRWTSILDNFLTIGKFRKLWKFWL